MEEFLTNISSFPTLIYSIGLVVISGFWVLAFIGLFDFEAFEVGVDIDLDVETDSDINNVGKIAGLLTTLGLTGVPITVVISLLVLNAWFVCYFISMFTPSLIQQVLFFQVLLNVGIVIVSFMISIVITAQMIKPLKGLFKKLNQEPISRSLIGCTSRIRSSRADNSFGEAECIHEGASLIVKVRAIGQQIFATGEQVVLVEHNKENDTFTIVSKKEFDKEFN